jgi:hypothetical protein
VVEVIRWRTGRGDIVRERAMNKMSIKMLTIRVERRFYVYRMFHGL